MTMYHQIKNTNIKTKYKQEKHGNSGSESTIVEIKNSLDGFNTKFDLTEEKKKNSSNFKRDRVYAVWKTEIKRMEK